MINEAAVLSPQENILPKKKAKTKENLKQRAYLNSLTSLIDFAGAQITGMIVSRFLISGLGGSLYGIWQMLGQMTGYAKMADTRATQVLKWTVATKKDIASEEELRSDVTSALLVTAFILPLVLIAGSIISWYAPIITKAEAAYYNLIRITCSLLILSLVINKIFDLYESVLRGMNLAFKRMGFRAVIVVLGGVFKIIALKQGYGLIGLSIVHVLISFITGFTFYLIVKKNVDWFGFGKTNMKKVLGFSKLSGWYMANTATDTLLTNSDKVLLGFITSPMLVSYYSLTMFVPLAIQGLIFKVIIGIIPGIGKLFGLKEYSKISKVWGNMNDFIFLLMTASGFTIILFNSSFLNVWVGKGYFAGNIVNTLIIIMIIQDTFIKHDGYIISATLDLKKKVYLTVLASLTFLILGYFLTKEFQIAGLCISIIIGKFLLFFGQRRVLMQKIQHEIFQSFFEKYHSLIVSFAMLGAACYLSSYVHSLSIFYIIGLAPITFVVAFSLFYFLGLNKNKRNDLMQIINSIKIFKTN